MDIAPADTTFPLHEEAPGSSNRPELHTVFWVVITIVVVFIYLFDVIPWARWSIAGLSRTHRGY